MLFQLSIRILLVAVLFVFGAYGTDLSPLPEQSNNESHVMITKNNEQMTLQQPLKNISQPLQSTPEKNGSSVPSSVKLNPVQSMEDSSNKTNVEQTISNSTKNETRENQKFKGEQSDLLKCCIWIPFDDDDDEEPTVMPEQARGMNHSEVVQNDDVSKINKSELSSKIAPKTAKETGSELNRTIYITVSAEVSDTANTYSTEISGINSNYTKPPSSTVLPEMIRSDQYSELDREEEKKSVEVNESKSSTIGIIALVTSTTFAGVLATVYVGMIIRRYYLQSRYGHRELLINDLEFDTNDLRHFEL